MLKSLSQSFLLSALLAISAFWLCSSFAAGVWRTGSRMPTSRSELAATSAGSKIYVAGGFSTFGISDAFEAYDVKSNSWKRLKSLPVPLHHTASANLNGSIYISGGYTTWDFSVKTRRSWCYDPSKNEWKDIAELPSPRAAHSMVASGGKLYVIGGVGSSPRHMFEYDPKRNEWYIIPSLLPTQREHLAAVAIGEKLYVFGGRNQNQRNLSVVEIYDLKGKTWSKGKAMPIPRSGFTAAEINGFIHVVGGESVDTGRILTSHDRFDPLLNTWVSQPAPPEPRHGLASAVQKNQWYLIGGATGAGYYTFISLTNRVDIFSP